MFVGRLKLMVLTIRENPPNSNSHVEQSCLTACPLSRMTCEMHPHASNTIAVTKNAYQALLGYEFA